MWQSFAANLNIGASRQRNASFAIVAATKVKASSAKVTITNKYDTIKDVTKAGAEAFKTEDNAH